MLMALIAATPLVLVFYYVVVNGAPALDWDFFTQIPAPVGASGGGMANALLGSGILLGLASVLAIPFGVLGGVYLAEYPSSRLSQWLHLSIDLLTSIPSIVVGLFVYAMVVIPMGGFSAHAGGLALALLMLPIITKTTVEILQLTPSSIREGALALGIPRWRVLTSILLGGSKSALLTGIMLAVARVAGETAPLLFTAFGNQFWPSGLNQPTPSLPVQIYTYATSPYEEWHRKAWAGALFLVMLVMCLNLLTRFLVSRNYLYRKRKGK